MTPTPSQNVRGFKLEDHKHLCQVSVTTLHESESFVLSWVGTITMFWEQEEEEEEEIS